MYLGLPQGFTAAGNARTGHYNELIKNVPRNVKITNDTLLYDSDISPIMQPFRELAYTKRKFSWIS